jgi:NAD(P)-dependent dehydrogenase (short-subunit alcohol dehydrogenase family)
MKMLEKFRLDGKVGIVIGAAQGLGTVFAEALAEAGANLVIVTRIDFIVNNAGINISKPAVKFGLEEWERVIKVNLTGVFLCCREVGKYIIERGIRGSIINISSGYGKVVDLIPSSAYYASKAGVIHLTKGLACEWGHFGIRVNALCPGWFPTPMGRPIHENKRWVQHMSNKIPLGEGGKI